MTHSCENFVAQGSLDIWNREIDPDPNALSHIPTRNTESAHWELVPGPWSQNRLPVAGGARHVTGSEQQQVAAVGSELAGKLQ